MFIKGKKAWNYGKHLTEDHKRKLSLSIKGKPNPKNSGENNRQWKGGRSKTKKGYIILKRRDYISSDKRGNILEHRFVMEQHLGRRLTKNEDVHHINGVRDDNRIENLSIVLHNNHKGKVCCPKCQYEFQVK